jgi:hypothetical protein
MGQPDVQTPDERAAAAVPPVALEYHGPVRRTPLSVLAVLSVTCAALTCPGVPIAVVVLMGRRWMGPVWGEMGMGLVLILLLWGFVSGQLAWRETHLGESPRRGRIMAEIGLALNAVWTIVYLAGLGIVAWVTRHGMG